MKGNRAPYKYDEPIDFGKYKGKTKSKTIGWIITNDPSYIQWCLDTIFWFKLSKKATEKFKITIATKVSYEDFIQEGREYSWMDRQDDADMAAALGLDTYGY